MLKVALNSVKYLVSGHPLTVFGCRVSDLLGISVKVHTSFSAYLSSVWHETELRVCREAVGRRY